MTKNKSVSATDLAKMVYCESSVINESKLTHLDIERINQGKHQHAIYSDLIKARNSKKS